MQMLTSLELLQGTLQQFAGIDKENFELSLPYWQEKEHRKGEFYNDYHNVCKHMGFIIDGVFRSYYIDEASGQEKNVFFFTRHQLVSSFRSMIMQYPCAYYTQAMVPSKILYIHVDNLNQLYKTSHQWEHFGRLVAEQAFNLAMAKAEGYMFMTPEQRYLDLVAQHPDICNAVPLYHISSYLGIQGPSLSRIRKRLSAKG